MYTKRAVEDVVVEGGIAYQQCSCFWKMRSKKFGSSPALRMVHAPEIPTRPRLQEAENECWHNKESNRLAGESYDESRASSLQPLRYFVQCPSRNGAQLMRSARVRGQPASLL